MNTQEERDLIRSLHDQADQLQGAHVSFDAVAGRAQSVVRRRRIVAGAGVLAAAAILVPAASLMGGPAPKGSEIPPATEAPSVSPQPSLDPSGEIQELSVDVPVGSVPGLSYLEGNILHRADGSTLALPKGDYGDAVTQGDTTFAVKYNEAGPSLYLFDAAGDPVGQPYPETSSVVATANGTAVAWIDKAGKVWTYGSTGLFSLGSATPGSSAVAVVGTGPCDGTEEGSACGVFYNQPGEGGPMNISEAGPLPVDGDLIDLSDATEMSFLVGMTSSTDDSSCHQVLNDPREVVFETCDRGPQRFSPEGNYLSADPTSYGDGMGASGLVILDLAGEVVAGWEWTGTDPNEQLTVVGHAWEDNEHVLAQVYGNGTWTMLRLGVDGSVERVLDQIQDDDFNPPWVFAQQ